jgi:segregation and condensation protein A
LQYMADTQPEDTLHYHLDDFDGPLDLLLFLIKKAEVNIYDIPVADITNQYLSYLKYSTQKDLENLTEFYVMAATLLYIKSRMLLPEDIDILEEMEDPRLELVNQLIEYQKYKKLSELMVEQGKSSEWMLYRKNNQPALPFPEDDDLWEQLEIWDLLKTFTSILSDISSEQVIDLYEEVSLNEKITLIHEFIEDRAEFLFTDLIVKQNSVLEVICAFLAILECVKTDKISIYQNKLFGDIRIRSKNEDLDNNES